MSEQVTPIDPAVYRLTALDRIRGALWGFSEPFRRDRTAAWASVLALLLAAAPGFTERYRKGRWGEYDPTIAVLTATLIALIWTAHYTFRSVRHARQAEERESMRRWFAKQSMAAGVLAELDYLKPSLTLMHARIAVRGVHFLERPQLRHALARIDLFSSGAARALSEFDSILRQIESHTTLYGADHAAAVEKAREPTSPFTSRSAPRLLDFDAKWVEDIRRMITGALDLIPLLVKRLLEET